MPRLKRLGDGEKIKIKSDFMNGITRSNLCVKYNLSYSAVNSIINRSSNNKRLLRESLGYRGCLDMKKYYDIKDQKLTLQIDIDKNFVMTTKELGSKLDCNLEEVSLSDYNRLTKEYGSIK